jgi:beta-galactosidase
MITRKIPAILFGADYFPEQWTEDIWQQDMRLMKKAHVNLVSVAIFSWALLQRDENTYTFEWLDKVMDLLASNNIYACLGTSSASVPTWLTSKYPDIVPVQETGLPLHRGSRQAYCPIDPTYLKYAGLLVQKMAQRYKNHKALALWHINNEYAQSMKLCFCPHCEREFRQWCKNKYKTIETLNETWGTNVWGEYYGSWDDIHTPKKSSGPRNSNKLLDYKRFFSDSIVKCFLNEYTVIKEITPDIPITTNFEGDFKHFDHSALRDYIDVVSWNCYPNPSDSFAQQWAASRHALMRGLKKKPFMLMEQAPSQVDWYPVNINKRPGIMRLFSYHAIAHGSDSVMFFQWRASKKGPEKYHSGMVPHCGKDSRIFKEIVQLGNELEKIKDIIDSDNDAKVAILYDNDSWWSIENPYGSGVRSFDNTTYWANFTQPFPSICIGYFPEIEYYFHAFYKMNIAVDIIPVNSDISQYHIVVAPLLHVVKPEYKQKLEDYVHNGGNFILTYFSGVLDKDATVFLNGYPGLLKELTGIIVEEYDPLMPDKKNKMKITDTRNHFKHEYSCDLWCDIIHTTKAEVIAVFGDDYYAEHPCITENIFGSGRTYYIATRPDESFMHDFITYISRRYDLSLPFKAPERVEVFCRKKNDQIYYFILNFNEKTVTVDLDDNEYYEMLSGITIQQKISLQKREVAVLKKT